MHIPPYYKKRTWQRFFVGVFVGAMMAYFIFILMYGTMYEDLLGENLDLQSQLTDIKNQNEALLQDKKDLDEKSKESLTVDTIDIKITNEKELRMDPLLTHQLIEMVKQEINHIIGQDIKVIAESNQLLIKAIENKGYTMDDFTYYFDVSLLVINQTIKIKMMAKLSK